MKARIGLAGIGMMMLVVGRVGAQAASIEGDVYLTMKSGDTKKGTGRTVWLLQENDSLAAMRKVVCDSVQTLAVPMLATLSRLNVATEMAISAHNMKLAKALTDTILLVAPQSKIARDQSTRIFAGYVAAAKIAESPTGMNAHYKFDVARPGKYFLYATWPIADSNYSWWAPVQIVGSSKTAVLDLDNSVERGQEIGMVKFVCAEGVK